MKKLNKLSLILTGSLLGAAMLLPASTTTPATAKPLEERVRHELVVLPWYNVFDNLAFQVNGDQVTLYGKVTRPTLKSDAENVIKRLEGVAHVTNKIDVLPLSPFDDRLRFALFRSIYSQPGLDRYAMGAIPGIHIIVDNGNVTLEGVVMNEMDKNLAFMRANGVSGVFSVKNNLQVESKTKKG
jgi:hyperosmotically inducible protein